MNIYEYGSANIDLKNKIILDCAIGAGESTYYWAKKIHEQGGTSKILGFDISLSDEDKNTIYDNLKDYRVYVELIEQDISDMNTIQSNTIDVINCDDTLVFLGNTEGIIAKTLKEFYRVLKDDGILVINSEIPINNPNNDYENNQMRRWNLAKAIYGLNGEIWSNEIKLEVLLKILNEIGFIKYDEYHQKPFKQGNPIPCIDEWEQIMREKLKALVISDDLKISLENEIKEIKANVIKNGMACPGYFSIKSKKKST